MVDYSKGKAADLPTKDDLATIAQLAEQQVDLEARIKKAEKAVTELKSTYLRLRTETLPEAMKGVGLTEFTLSNGAKIKVDDDYQVSIREDNKPGAYHWLREHGHGAIIKNDVTLSFGMGEDADKEKAVKIAEAIGFKYTLKEAIHAGTLKAWAKAQFLLQEDDDEEIREKGHIPENLITVFRLAISKVTLPKKKK